MAPPSSPTTLKSLRLEVSEFAPFRRLDRLLAPQLTFLSLRHLHMPLDEPGALWGHLSALPSLLVLDVAHVFCEEDIKYSYFDEAERPSSHAAWMRMLTTFTEWLARLTALQELDLSANGLDSPAWQLVAPVAARLPLRSLDLSCNEWLELPLLRAPGCDAPVAFTSLERLVLPRCKRIRSEGLVHELHACHKLTALKVEPEWAGYDTALSFLRGLAEAPFCLESFGYDHVIRCEEDAEPLSLCLAKWTGLTRLHLVLDCEAVEDVEMAPPGPLTALRALRLVWDFTLSLLSAEPIAQLTGLTELELNGASYADVMLALPQLTALETLHVYGLVHPHEERSFAVAIAPLTRLTRLSLPDTFLGDTFVQIFAEGLWALNRLQELHMRSACISEKGMAILTQGMPWMPTLRVWDLSYNPIGLPGAQLLAQVLPGMTALEDLDVRGCGAGEAEVDSDLCEEAMAAISFAVPSSIVHLRFRS